MTSLKKMSEDQIASSSHWKSHIEKYIDSHTVHGGVAALIILSMVVLGLKTFPNLLAFYGLFNTLEDLILLLFMVEIGCRIAVYGKAYFKDPWHVFDFIIVAVSILAYGDSIQVLRIVRVFWFLRLTSTFEQLQYLIGSIIRAIPSLLTVVILLFITLYTFSVIGSFQYGQTHPHEYGTVLKAMATLTQSMLMEHTWSERLESLQEFHPYAWAFIFPLLIIVNYLLLHLVFGVIINALHRQFEHEQEQKRSNFIKRIQEEPASTADENHPLSQDMMHLIKEVQDMKQKLEKITQQHK